MVQEEMERVGRGGRCRLLGQASQQEVYRVGCGAMVRLLCQVLGYVRGGFITDLGCVTWAGGACEHLHGHKVPSSTSSVYQHKAHLETFAGKKSS